MSDSAPARRPAVTVVMPFAGSPESARRALTALRSLQTQPGDQLILADNEGGVAGSAGVEVVPARGEHSPARARNAGAAHARCEWILFLDADCEPRPDLLDAYFRRPVAGEVGALAGEVRAAPQATTLAARYGARRGFLGQEAHLAHPYRPRAVAANLLVRRAAFAQVGGFYEGVRAAEDTDFSWRLQEAGWRLELCPEAAVEHRYRASVAELRRQWRGYAAGRAWLARRYTGFRPEPALRRALRRVVREGPRAVRPRPPAAPDAAPSGGERSDALSALERGRFLALDALLAVDELVGFTLSNRPEHEPRGPVRAVLLAEHFPAAGDPLVELAETLGTVRVEAASRPREPDPDAVSSVPVEYREDDGFAARWLALAALVRQHPLRALRDLAQARDGQPSLLEIAPAVLRIERERGARLLALGSGPSLVLADRIAALTARPLDDASPERRA